jgi:hypothetical protein
MEILIIILVVITVILYLKVKKLEKHLTVLSFSDKLINKLLVKNNLILPSEIDIITNEVIGDMHEDEGNKIINSAKSIGIIIPKYMNEEQLNEYVETQEFKRRNNQISYTDRMIMEESDS